MFEGDENYTRVSEFVIVGFPGLHPSFFHLVAWFFFCVYVTTVVGNFLLVVLFALEHSLQKPMYIIMLSLALSDIGFATVALPNLIARWWWNDGRISFHTCMFQEQMIHYFGTPNYFGTLNSLIMLTMAMDRYLAICHPLRYPMLMTNRTMSGLTVFSWISAQVAPGIVTIDFSRKVSFCGPNRILHVYCDAIALTRLSCSNMVAINNSSYGLAMFVLLVPLSLIIFSYISIIVTVMRMANAQTENLLYLWYSGMSHSYLLHPPLHSLLHALHAQRDNYP
ncbi:olfactory receptor 1500-like isoform X2 [Oncorhynchus keta]|uniref:olfactory receptor 1500-like isoform X2 n=1 Tax=Oncorhynchus keta TaxID=8018 RepID=UPI00227A6343|nr:olfactory receptor 1500-like isoform X2 [Oncorhynchus keta]XP_052385051.1 olfactory receptor 1500-like isoform X2 [Oncorhynchus keta]